LTPLPVSGQKHCVLYLDAEGFVNFRKDDVIIKQELKQLQTAILDVSTPLPSKADVDEVYLFYEPKWWNMGKDL